MPLFKMTKTVSHDGIYYLAGSTYEISAKDAGRFPAGALEPVAEVEPANEPNDPEGEKKPKGK